MQRALCDQCVHRVLEEGGRGDCPVRRRDFRAYLAYACGAETDCPRFRLGDVMPRALGGELPGQLSLLEAS